MIVLNCKYILTNRCTGASPGEVSVTTTVPASDESAKKNAMYAGGSGEGSSPSVATPRPTIKRSDTAESVPKLSREIQSRRVLAKAPTLHYSPRAKASPKKTLKTAVKAKAKSGGVTKTKGSKTKASKTKTIEPKMESPAPATSQAVASALARQSTQELATRSHPPSPSGDPSSDSEAQGSGSSEDEAPANEEERTLEQVRARKAAHARYMRFSRSIKSKGFLAYLILCYIRSTAVLIKLLVLQLYHHHIFSERFLPFGSIRINYTFLHA